MAVTILETLNLEDLERVRTVTSNVELVQGPLHNLSSEETRRVWLDYWACCADVLARYGIEGEDAVQAKISPITGSIYTGTEE